MQRPMPAPEQMRSRPTGVSSSSSNARSVISTEASLAQVVAQFPQEFLATCGEQNMGIDKGAANYDRVRYN